MAEILASIDDVREFVLECQGFGDPAWGDKWAEKEEILALVRRILAVQIDTISVVHRSHYLLVYSRLGNYRLGDFDDLIYSVEEEGRKLFEYWFHAACIIPFELYWTRIPVMNGYREGNPYSREWLSKAENREAMEVLKAHIDGKGAAATSSFKDKRSGESGWWNWKPSKVALEQLYYCGDLMVGNRKAFQKVYDLKERVLPRNVDAQERDAFETRRFLLEKAALALGVFDLLNLGDYTGLKRPQARPVLQELVKEGVLRKVDLKLEGDGVVPELYIHADNVAALESIVREGRRRKRVAFLSPFDNLLWGKETLQKIWGFQTKVEAYTPAPQRRWGYFCLPILLGNRLVGRIDPKFDRGKKVFEVKRLHLEDGVAKGEKGIARIVEGLRELAAFHGAKRLEVREVVPKELEGVVREVVGWG